MEEILLKTFRSGTTIDYFSTLLDERYSSDVVPAYVTFDNANQPTSLHTFDGVSLWARNSENYFVPLSTVTTNYITGKTFSQTTDVELLPYEIEKIKKKFIASANSLYSGQTISYVFSSNHLVDDVFTTVKITKTTDTLDTLSVYNDLQNSIPIQEATTGVIFGKLEAIQKVKSRSGDSAIIPLREVPIGIFAPDDMFPAATSFDENGDRITLNYKETADINYYHNQKSYNMDLKYYLRTSTGLTEMPNHLRYVTKTNKNGEFVIYDVPVGTHTLMFDVNLLAQDLTKDEVALNRFPYPGSTDSNVDYIPHFFFQQVPVDVVPSWGPNQSGYTEVNIAVNLDLRKWATYYVTPITYRDKTIDSAEMLAAGISAPLRISLRDMSKKDYPTTNIPVVEIQEMLSRDMEQSLEWRNEFAQLKDSAEFQTHDFHAFKVPANIYDPIGDTTREMDKIEASSGSYESLKGVWLAAYQFRMSYIDKSAFRDSGLDKIYGNDGTNVVMVTRSHYNLNRGDTDINSSNIAIPTSMNGTFPYTEPWSDIFPEPYSIPRRPKVLNPIKPIDNNGNYQGDVRIPKYLDGDLVGEYDTSVKSGGYGSQFYSKTSTWIANRFSKRVTRDYVFKYENGNSWLEEYANGYQPYNTNYAVMGESKVLNGEKYQRVEAGYAYWLRPEGWPKVQHFSPYRDGIMTSTLPPFPASAPTNGGTNGNAFMAPQQDITLKLDPTTVDKEGSLELYRIIKPDPDNLINPDPEVITTKAQFVFWRIYRRKGAGRGSLKLYWVNQGDQKHDLDNCFRFGHQGSTNFYFTSLLLKIRNTGEERTNYRVLLGGFEISIGTIEVGQTQEVPMSAADHTTDLIVEIEGNSNFDFNNFKFLNAKCEINFSHFEQGSGISPDYSPTDNYNFNANGTTDINPIVYYLMTDLNGVFTNISHNIKGKRSCNNRASSRLREIRHRGFVLGCERGPTDWVGSWWTTDFNAMCTGNICCQNEYERIDQARWAIPCSER